MYSAYLFFNTTINNWTSNYFEKSCHSPVGRYVLKFKYSNPARDIYIYTLYNPTS